MARPPAQPALQAPCRLAPRAMSPAPGPPAAERHRQWPVLQHHPHHQLLACPRPKSRSPPLVRPRQGRAQKAARSLRVVPPAPALRRQQCQLLRWPAALGQNLDPGLPPSSGATSPLVPARQSGPSANLLHNIHEDCSPRLLYPGDSSSDPTRQACSVCCSGGGRV